MNYRFVANDILTTFKKTFDDKDMSLIQVIYWIQVVANKLRRIHLEKHDTGLFLSTFSPVLIKKDSSLKNRKYIDLPQSIIDLDNERGIKYITYNFETGCCCSGPNFAQVFFQPTTPAKSWILNFSPFSRPKPSNPYFYRVGDTVNDGTTSTKVNRIYFLGIECVDVSDVEVGLMSGLNPVDICSLDEEVPVPDSLLQTLITEVLNLGRFAFMIPKERINEGSDAATQAAQPGVVAAPQPTQTEEEIQ